MSLPKVAAHFETQLVNKIDSTSTTMELSSVSTPAGSLGAGTYGFVIEEETTGKREYVIGTLSGSTVTFTHRDLSPLDATTTGSSSDTDRQSHRKGSSVKITNFPLLLLLQRIFVGDDQLDASSPLEYDAAPSLVAGNQLATTQYVLDNINGGTVSLQNQLYAGDAGETISAGEYVYLKESDGEWYKVDATDISTIEARLKGIAQGAGTDGNAISGGVLVEGLDNSISYTAGQLYYASDTAGALATSAGTYEHVIGIGDANNKLVLLPDYYTPTESQKDFLAAVTGMMFLYAASSAPTGFLLCNGQAVSRTTYADLFAIIGTTWGAGDGSTTFNVPDMRGSVPLGYGQRTETFTFEDGDVNTGTDVITVDENYYLQTGQAVALTTSGTLPTGLSATTYYVIRTSATTIKLATSVANANAGTAVDITAAAGGGTHTLTQTFTDRAMADEGGEETHALTDAEMPSHVHTEEGGGTGLASGGGSSADNTSSKNTGSAGSDTPHNNMPPYVTVNYIIKT